MQKVTNSLRKTRIYSPKTYLCLAVAVSWLACGEEKTEEVVETTSTETSTTTEECVFTWYADADGDTFGDDATTEEACEQPDGYVAEGGDCNDNDASINPLAEDINTDDIDQNCDGCTPFCDPSWVCGDDSCGGECGTPCGDFEECIGNAICVGTGELRVTLEWNTAADLDIKVVEPSGEVINYSSTNSSSGGYLDVDSHAGCSGSGSYGVENVYWATEAPSGSYEIYVNNYSNCDSAVTDYSVTIDNSGEISQFSGTTSTEGQEDYITAFSVE